MRMRTIPALTLLLAAGLLAGCGDKPRAGCAACDACKSHDRAAGEAQKADAKADADLKK